MYPRVVTKDPTAVEVEVQAAYREMYPRGSRFFVPQAFGWAIDCFSGQHPEYQPVDAGYHDLEHTLQGTLCFVRLVHGRHRAKVRPQLSRRLFELGVLAILLHDTGYLKRKSDVKGTGAKYTAIHVGRSMEFAAGLLKRHDFASAEIMAVRNMIHCTAPAAVPARIAFRNAAERIVGCAVGTADLLGQMAAEDYVDKLPVLYLEFAEAARHPRGKGSLAGMFSDADDLIRKTPAFWEQVVRCRLERDFEGVYRFLNNPYPAGSNYYVDRINANIKRLRRHLASRSQRNGAA
jgi:hypothetical protein